jgi:outer membrane autotransporter protein
VTGAAPSALAQTVSYTGTDVDLSLGPVPVVTPTDDTGFTALGTAALLNAQQSNTLLLGHLAGSDPAPPSSIEGQVPSRGQTRVAFNGGAQQLSQVVAALPDAMERIGGWFRGIGDFDRLGGTAHVPGFTTSAGGFLAGIDRPVGDHIVAGIAAGYNHIDLSQNDGERGKIDTPRLALYGRRSRRFGARFVVARWRDRLWLRPHRGVALDRGAGRDGVIESRCP